MARRPKPTNLEPLLNRMMALAEPSRWSIVRLLGEKPRTVGQLARATGLSLAVTSRHVQRLRSVGLVVGEKRGKELHCARSGPETVVGQWLDVTLGETAVAVAEYTEKETPRRPVRAGVKPKISRKEEQEIEQKTAEPEYRPGGDIDDFLL
jgi:DNA-binding transcriptional ArsR family regulator